jgi:hypothetical protein
MLQTGFSVVVSVTSVQCSKTHRPNDVIRRGLGVGAKKNGRTADRLKASPSILPQFFASSRLRVSAVTHGNTKVEASAKS